MTFTIFVSHASDDAPLVEALRSVIDDTLDDVSIRSSSSSPDRGGVQPGESWLAWINESVVTADATMVVLTATSYTRPWVWWEAGAVSALSLASRDAREKLIIPVVFELAVSELPGPLGYRQAVSGSDQEEITDLLKTLHGRVRRPSLNKFQQLVDSRVPRYVDTVQSILTQRSLAAAGLAAVEKSTAPRRSYEKTFQGEDLDLTVVNFSAQDDPEDATGVTIVNDDGDWVIQIDVESPLRGQTHAVDLRYRRGSPGSTGKVLFTVDSGEVRKHEEIIDLATGRHHKYMMEYLIFRHAARVAKVDVRPLDEAARQSGAFCLDYVVAYSLPRRTGMTV